MSSEAIIVDSIGKRYEIYDEPRDRLLQILMPAAQKILGLVEKSYFKSFWALQDVSFKIARGDTVAIIGQNGSGKSTLLQLIYGTLFPTTGSVSSSGKIAAILELGSGFNTEFTGRENIYLSGLVYGMDRATVSERYDAIVAFAELEEFIDQPIKTYSSGMYVRLAFAIIAHIDADILIIDEALSVGDVRFTQKCMRFLRNFQKNGTLLFVSHDTSAVLSLCSRAIWIDKGQLRADGPAKETVEAYLAEQHAIDRERAGQSVNVSVASSKEILPSLTPVSMIEKAMIPINISIAVMAN